MAECPDQGIGNVRFSESVALPEQLPAPSELQCETLLGGLLKSYRREAA
jgi:hypothetical protein